MGLVFDRRLAARVFFDRYPLLSDVGVLQALIDSGAVESWMPPTLRTDKHMSFNEEAVAAAHAAEVLRRQGRRDDADEASDYIKARIGSQLQSFVGVKLTDKVRAHATAEIERTMADLVKVGQIADWEISSQVDPGVVTVNVKAKPTWGSPRYVSVDVVLK